MRNFNDGMGLVPWCMKNAYTGVENGNHNCYLKPAGVCATARFPARQKQSSRRWPFEARDAKFR